MKKFAFTLLVLMSAGLLATAQTGRDSFVNGVTHDGESITADLPGKEHIKNIGSKLDGAGMCVNSSIEMAALYHGHEEMRGFRDWTAAKYPGGSWPERVEKHLAAWFVHKGIKPIPYLQYEGNSPEELMSLIDKTGRMACITYGYSPRYGRGYIAHMVNGVLYKRYGVVLDNNFPGETSYEWMAKEEFIRRTRLQPGGRQGAAWVFVWLTPGAPPPPKARK